MDTTATPFLCSTMRDKHNVTLKLFFQLKSYEITRHKNGFDISSRLDGKNLIASYFQELNFHIVAVESKRSLLIPLFYLSKLRVAQVWAKS